MIGALLRAIGQLADPRILGMIGACALLSVGCFVGAWFGIDWLIVHVVPEEGTWRTIAEVAGGLTTIGLAWLLFPLVTSAFVGFFLESVARVVEAKHYPGLPKAPGLSLLGSIGVSLRFLVIVLVANALLLLTLLVPPVYAVAYFVVNGWLIGREYFELVALRRLDPAATRTMRIAHQFEITVSGALFTFLLLVPVVNLVVPIVATATMLHRFESWRRSAPAQAGGG